MMVTTGCSSTISSTDACMSIVHNLMCYRQGGESETFSKRAVESLVKKLKSDKKDELDALISAVTSNGQTQTKCVTIPRTLDGRLQVAGRKGFPHVIYAKIWRWPDLHKNELKQLNFCQYSFEKKADAVCVNPYHYERVVSPSIDLSSLSLVGAGGMEDVRSASLPGPLAGNTPMDAMFASPGGNPFAPPPRPGLQFNPGLPGGAPPPGLLGNPGGGGLHLGSSPGAHSQGQPMHSSAPLVVPSVPSPVAAGPGTPRHTHQWTPESTAVFQRAASERNFWAAGQAGEFPGGPSHGNPLGQHLVNNSGHPQPALSSKPEPKEWCHIQYYELAEPVGEIFKAAKEQRAITVDGYVDPVRDNRFCLGALSNVHRTTASDKARLHIGKGVRLELRGEGDVWLKCMSQHPVFVRSYYLDRQSGRSPGELVHKIYPNAEIQVFSLELCKRELEAQAQTVTSAVAAQAAAVSGTLPGPSSVGGIAPAINFQAAAGIGVDDLRKLCLIRISFVKGWGPDYVRPDITHTPCWIEVTLCRALQLLDEVLVSLPGPDPRSSAAIDG